MLNLNERNDPMHELGILTHALKQVVKIAKSHRIRVVKAITLEIGEQSGVVIPYLRKLYPAAVSQFSILRNAELKIDLCPGKNLTIKDIRYET